MSDWDPTKLAGCYVCNGIVECRPDCPRGRIIKRMQEHHDA